MTGATYSHFILTPQARLFGDSFLTVPRIHVSDRTRCFVHGYRRDGRNLQPFHSRRVNAMRWFHSGGGSLPNHAYIDSASNGSRYCKYHAGQCASSTTSSTSSCSSDPARLQQHVSRRGNTSFATSYTTPCGHTCTIAVPRVKFRR